MASLTELSFNWLGFISAMISNISFTYRSIFSKKAMVLDALLQALNYVSEVLMLRIGSCFFSFAD